MPDESNKVRIYYWKVELWATVWINHIGAPFRMKNRLDRRAIYQMKAKKQIFNLIISKDKDS